MFCVQVANAQSINLQDVGSASVGHNTHQPKKHQKAVPLNRRVSRRMVAIAESSSSTKSKGERKSNITNALIYNYFTRLCQAWIVLLQCTCCITPQLTNRPASYFWMPRLDNWESPSLASSSNPGGLCHVQLITVISLVPEKPIAVIVYRCL